MGILVDVSTGKFLDTGCLGNLLEYVNALNEMEIEHTLAVYSEDEAYAEFA